MSINLSIKQIIDLAGFAGLVVDEEKSFAFEEKETMLEQEFVISENQKVDLEDGTYYEGMTVHCAEYPEEGAFQLEDKEPVKRDLNAEKYVQTHGSKFLGRDSDIKFEFTPKPPQPPVAPNIKEIER